MIVFVNDTHSIYNILYENDIRCFVVKLSQYAIPHLAHTEFITHTCGPSSLNIDFLSINEKVHGVWYALIFFWYAIYRIRKQ